MMDEVERVNKEEDERYGDKDLEELGLSEVPIERVR